MRTSKGYILFDVVIALIMVGALIAMLTGVIVHHNNATERLRQQRTAAATVENALLRIQRNLPPNASSSASNDAPIHIQRLTGPAVQDHVWIEVTTHAGERAVSLAGMAPIASVTQWEKATNESSATPPEEGTP
jgi:type II secretory pathway pseudopilin PulG